METTQTPPEPSARAIASLVLGVIAYFALPCIGGILAVVLGWGERSTVGRAGFILGWIHLALSGLAILVAMLAIAFMLVVGGLAG